MLLHCLVTMLGVAPTRVEHISKKSYDEIVKARGQGGHVPQYL